MKTHIHIIGVMFIIIALLAGCGSGNGESPALTVTGVAAAGAPLAGNVTLKDSSDTTKQLSTSLAFDGSYSFNVSGLTAPFLLQATGTADGKNYTLYSLVVNAGNCNINPLTHLAVTMANGGQDPIGIFVAPTTAQIAAISNALPVAATSIHDKLASIFNNVGASPVNFMTDQFTANGQGIDLLFDMVAITITNGSVSMINKEDSGTILPSTSIASGVLSSSPNVSMMSSVFTITGSIGNHGTVGSVSAKSKAPPYPFTPVMTVKSDAQADYKLFVPNGTYEVCGGAVGSDIMCVDVTISDANVVGINFPAIFVQ